MKRVQVDMSVYSVFWKLLDKKFKNGYISRTRIGELIKEEFGIDVHHVHYGDKFTVYMLPDDAITFKLKYVIDMCKQNGAT